MKLTPQQRATLEVLTAAGSSGATARHFHEAGVGRHSARIAELRKLGFEIQHRARGHRHFLRSGLTPAEDACEPVPPAGVPGRNRPRFKASLSARRVQVFDGNGWHWEPYEPLPEGAPTVDEFLADCQAGREPWPVAPLEEVAA